MRKLSRLATAALFAGALQSRLPAEDGVTDTEIVLGSHTALSGPVSAWGIGSTEGTRMRFDEANEKGIHGRKIKLVVEDNQYQVPRAVQAANKLHQQRQDLRHAGRARHADEQRGVRRAAGQGRAEPVPVHGGPLDGGALPQAQVRDLLDLLRPGALVGEALHGEGGQEEAVLDVPGHRLRARDPRRGQGPGQGAEARGGGGGFLRPDRYRLRRARHQAEVGGMRPRRHGLDHPRQHPGGGNGQEARLDGRDCSSARRLPTIRSWRARPAASWTGSTRAPACRIAYADTSSDEIKAWSAKYKAKTGQDANSAAQFGYVGADIVVKALEATGKDLTRARFLAALEVDQGLQAALPRARR